jgi:hypothetical protein
LDSLPTIGIHFQSFFRAKSWGKGLSSPLFIFGTLESDEVPKKSLRPDEGSCSSNPETYLDTLPNAAIQSTDVVKTTRRNTKCITGDLGMKISHLR